MAAHASPSAPERVEADRVWFAILFPGLTGFVAVFISITILAREDLSKQPSLTLVSSAFIGAVITIPALIINAVAFRKGVRSRGSWYARGVLAAVPLTLLILAILVGFFRLVQTSMEH